MKFLQIIFSWYVKYRITRPQGGWAWGGIFNCSSSVNLRSQKGGVLLLILMRKRIVSKSTQKPGCLVKHFLCIFIARYVFARNAVTKQSSYSASLGLLRCARNDEHCIYMHDLCLTRQPLFDFYFYYRGLFRCPFSCGCSQPRAAVDQFYKRIYYSFVILWI